MTRKVKCRKIGPAGLELIKTFEGLSLDAYLCPAGVWSIGYGHTNGVYERQHITQEQANTLLLDDLSEIEKWLSPALQGLNLSQNEYDACLSLAFNIGSHNFNKSTLKRFLINGDKSAAAGEFQRWNKARGPDGKLRPLAGLTRRRDAEYKLFTS